VSEPGRCLWGVLHLLDRQILDCDGRPVAKVDDIEISLPTEAGAAPVVTALLCGPAALARRFGRRTGAFFEALRNLNRDRRTSPASITIAVVKEYGTAITLSVRRDSLTVNQVEHFLGQHVISHIPGAGAPPDNNERPESES
jgi:hypothetical protein